MELARELHCLRASNAGGDAPRTLNVFTTPQKEKIMFRWAIAFFILAIIAAVFGFGGIAAGAAGIGKILFVGFLILAVVGFFMGSRKAV